jgi:hypothetical protein
MDDLGEEMSDFEDVKLKNPKTVEELLSDLAYKEEVKGIFEVDIIMSIEFIQDLCKRLLTLEKYVSKGVVL